MGAFGKKSWRRWICALLVLVTALGLCPVQGVRAEENGDSFMHISFDDVTYCFGNLSDGSYSSLFDEPFFAWLEGLHESYGAKFSLYTYNNVLKAVPDTYASEFAQASDWLKIGLHAEDTSSTYASATYEQGYQAWNTFAGYVKTVTGTADSIDRMPRLHYFAGSQDALEGMQAADCGALGFLAADDSRNSYYFDSAVSGGLYGSDHITDHNNGLVFLTTDMRGDWFLPSFSSANSYCVPVYSTVYEELEYRFGSEAFTGTLDSYLFFCHEWQIYDGSTLDSDTAWTEDACKFSSRYGVAFDYPQNRTFGETEHDIAEEEETDGSGDAVTTRNAETVSIVNSLSDIRYVTGSFSGGRNETPVTQTTGRAVSRYYVLRVSGGEKLTLEQNIDGVTVSYAIKEFTDIPLTAANVTSGGQTYQQWLTDALTLQPDTQYILIGFKNGDGAADFTDAQLEMLNSCLTFEENEASDSAACPENPLASLWPGVDTDLTHIICYGQSFSTGSDAPYYSDPTVDGVYVYGHITDSTNGTELKALTAGTGNQHPVISAGNVLSTMLAEAGYDTDIVLGSYGSGGRTIAQLMSASRQAQIKEEKGYDYDILSSGRYEVFQSSVASLASYAEKTGQSISCPVIVYLQGETDQNTDQQLGYPENPVRAGYGAGGDKELYKEYMTRLKEDMQAEVMAAYGQTEKPLFIIYQVSGTYVRTQYSSINMAQIEFAQENADVILVQTPYFASHYTVSHHLTQNGYRWLGEYIARYMFTALVEREKPWPMLPSAFETEEGTVRVTVDGAVDGLSVDTYTVEDATNNKNCYGFYLTVDGALVVPDTVTVEGNEILLTLPERTDLTAAGSVYLYYGGQYAKGTGNIRDNCAETGFYEYLDDSADTGTGNNQGVSHSSLDENGNSIIGQKYPLYNWLASFCYALKTDSLHVHSYQTTVVEPTCIHRGYTAHACACGDSYADAFTPVTGVHAYEAVVTAPTCTQEGYTTYTCVCGVVSSVGEYVAALGHLEITDPAELPTAERTGLTEGSHCDRCREILTQQQILPATGYADTLKDGAFRVLIIGNTFAQDAADQGSGVTDSQLLNILRSMLPEDISFTLGLITYSASSMAWHATQAERGTALYAFYVTDSQTDCWSSYGRVSSADALQWADWDVVILQPFSAEAHTGTANPIHASQEDEKFYPLETSTAYMLDHVNRYAPNAEVYCYMHWQRTRTNKLNAYLSGHNTMAAFFPTVMSYRGTQSGARYSDIIPVGTAIQNARTTYLALLSYHTDSSASLKNDPQFGLQRDENHLSMHLGRYISAVTVACAIVPEQLRKDGCELPPIRQTEALGALPAEYGELALSAALAALNSWERGSLGVTVLEGYEEDPTVAASEKLSALNLEIPCASNGEKLQDFICQAVLAELPEDFAVDAVSRTEGAAIGDSFSCDVTIRFGYTSLTVTVSCAVTGHVPGDINGDGEVNNKDLTRLFKYLTGYDVDVLEVALDVNGDGSVNNKDQTRLFRYLSGWDVEIC